MWQVWGPLVTENRAKFADYSLNPSGEIPPKAAGGIFDRFLNFDNCQLEVVSDVVSGVVVGPTGIKDLVKFGASWSNCSRDIRLPHFVTNVPRRPQRHRRTPVITSEQNADEPDKHNANPLNILVELIDAFATTV